MHTWLADLITAQFFIVMLLAGYTLLLLLLRKYRTKSNQRIYDKYHEAITLEMIELPSLAESVMFWSQRRIRRDLFHDVLVSQMKMVSGDEREHLLGLYAALGFQGEDMRRCKSIFWVQRLAAVIHLGEFGSPALAPLFHSMLRDKTPLVAVAATLSLSKLKHKLNSAALIHELPRAILDRANVLQEVMTNLGNMHGVSLLGDVIRETDSIKMSGACIRALKHIRTLEACEALNGVLRHPGGISGTSVREIIETLSQIGDPSSITAVRPFLAHPDPGVRAESAVFLLKLQDPESLEKIARMQGDKNVEVRRAIQALDYWQKGA